MLMLFQDQDHPCVLARRVLPEAWQNALRTEATVFKTHQCPPLRVYALRAESAIAMGIVALSQQPPSIQSQIKAMPKVQPLQC
jgi:hypothetical protein